MIGVSLVSSSSISALLLVEGGENSVTAPEDYWMTTDMRESALGVRKWRAQEQDQLTHAPAGSQGTRADVAEAHGGR